MRNEAPPSTAGAHTASALLQRVRAVSAAALKTGALQPIETTSTPVHSADSPPFLVRVVANLRRKDEAGASRGDPTKSASADGDGKGENKRKKKKGAFNPFLPYERDLYVEHVGPQHVMLLNKFNVVDDHILLVTEAFEEQDEGMSAGDVEAMVRCLDEVDGLAFYNCGTVAGASQPHRHVQVVCGGVGEMAGMAGLCPFDGMLSEAARAAGKGEVFQVERLGFVHAGVGVEEAGVREWWDGYCKLLDRVRGACGEGVAFNVIATRRWMVVVGRREECFEGVSVNALGFVGCLLVRNEEMLETVQRVGGLTVLRHAAFGRGEEGGS